MHIFANPVTYRHQYHWDTKQIMRVACVISQSARVVSQSTRDSVSIKALALLYGPSYRKT